MFAASVTPTRRPVVSVLLGGSGKCQPAPRRAQDAGALLRAPVGIASRCASQRIDHGAIVLLS